MGVILISHHLFVIWKTDTHAFTDAEYKADSAYEEQDDIPINSNKLSLSGLHHSRSLHDIVQRTSLTSTLMTAPFDPLDPPRSQPEESSAYTDLCSYPSPHGLRWDSAICE